MLSDKNELRKIFVTVIELFSADNVRDISELLKSSEITAEQTYYDNWNGGTTYYSIYLKVSVDIFVKYQDRQTELEAKIKEKIELILRPYENTQIGQVLIIPKSIPKIDWDKITDLYTKDTLITDIGFLKDM